jgi:hypothetical protein
VTLAVRCRAVVAAALIVLAVVVPPGAAAATPRQDGDARASALVLVRQTPTVAPGGAFDVAVLGTSVVAGAELSVTVHDRVRSRSELTTSSAGTDLRRPLHVQVAPMDQLPADSDGARRATVALDDTQGGNEAVTVPGVYPVAVTAMADGATTTLVTHAIVRPLADSTSPPLAVAVLATVDGEQLDATEIADTTAMVNALNAAPDVPATVAVRPETVDPIAGSAEEPGASLLAALRAAAGRSWLALPYAPVSPDALADAGIPEELLHQLGHGAAVLREALGAAPTQSTWVAGPDLGGDGLALLPANGVRHVLLDPDQVQPVADGVLSVARPFHLLPPRSSRDSDADTAEAVPVDAMLRDARLAESLDGDVEPALVASRVLAELASLWFEQEGVSRAIVVPVDRGLHAGALSAILDGLRGAPLFRPVSVDEAFTTASPLLSRGRVPVERALEPEDGSSLGSALASRVRAARTLRGSVESMVGSSAGLLRVLDGHLLRSTSDRLDARERRGELGALRAAVDVFTTSITTPRSVTITLTARDGTVPLTIRNDTGGPVDVRIRLRSPKLDLPDGDTITLRLEETITRRDVAVRTRASGAFPFEVEITSPDGELVIASAHLSVRSTAVSGVGLVLSAGAGLFLIIWWARHWREARRSAKLVDSSHPVHRTSA